MIAIRNFSDRLRSPGLLYDRSRSWSRSSTALVHFLSPGLLQLSVLWHLRLPHNLYCVGWRGRKTLLNQSINQSLASQKDWWTGCSWFKTPLPIWWPLLDTSTIYRRCFRQLPWLPVCQRVHFKVVTFVHQSLSGISPSYLVEDCCLVAHTCDWRLRSTASQTCVVSGHTAPLATERSWLPSCTIEQSSVAPERRWLIVQWIPAVVKDICVWTVGPQRVWTLLTVPTRDIRTYLHACMHACMCMCVCVCSEWLYHEQC